MAWQRKAAWGGLLSGRIAAAAVTPEFEWRLYQAPPGDTAGAARQGCDDDDTVVQGGLTAMTTHLGAMFPVSNGASGPNGASAKIEEMWIAHKQHLHNVLSLQTIGLNGKYYSGFIGLRIVFQYIKNQGRTLVFAEWDDIVQSSELRAQDKSCELSPPEGGGGPHVIRKTWRCRSIAFVEARSGKPLPDKTETDLLTLNADDDAMVTQARDAFQEAMNVALPRNIVTLKVPLSSKTGSQKWVDYRFWIHWDNLVHFVDGPVGRGRSACSFNTGGAFVMTVERGEHGTTNEKWSLARFGGPYEFEPRTCDNYCSFVPVAQAWVSKQKPDDAASLKLPPNGPSVFHARSARFALQKDQEVLDNELHAVNVFFPLFPRRAEMTSAQFCGSIRFQTPMVNGQMKTDVYGASCTICTHMCAKSEAMEQSDASITQFKDWCRCAAGDEVGLRMWDSLKVAGGKAQTFWSKVRKYSIGENRKHELFTGDSTSFSPAQQEEIAAADADQQLQQEQQQQAVAAAGSQGQFADAPNAFDLQQGAAPPGGVELVPAGTRTGTTTEGGCCGDSTTEDSASCSAEQESTSKTANGKESKSKTCGGTEQESTTTKQAQESTTTKQAKSCGQGTCSNSNNINIKLEREE